MKIKQVLLVMVVLLISTLMMSCGVSQEQYDAVLAERDTAQAKVEPLEIKVDALEIRTESLQSELDEVQEQLESLENERSELEEDLATAQSQISSLQSDLDNTSANLTMAQAQIAETEAIYKIVLFFDDFEDGNTAGWELEEDWSITQEEGNYILQGTGPCYANASPQEWTNYTLEARIKFIHSAKVIFKATEGLGHYYLNIVPDGVELDKKLLTDTYLAKSETSLHENQWYDIKIHLKPQAQGIIIEIYIDGTMLFGYADSDPIPSGTIGFEAAANSAIYLDDIIVIRAR